MANHVSNHINLVQGNDACKDEFITLFQEYGERITRPSYHGDGTIEIWEYKEIQEHPFLEGYSDDNWYQWGCDNIGAKWAHIDDASEENVYIVSAWSPVVPYVEKLVEYLSKFDEQVQIRLVYEDEFYNFIGKGDFSWDEYNGTTFSDIEEEDGASFNEWLETTYKIEIKGDFEWHEPNDKMHGNIPQEVLENRIHEWYNGEEL